MPDVPRRCWCVPESSSSRHRTNVTDSATGITYIFKATQPAAATPQDAASVGISYYFISLLLNGVLAIMTVTRAIDQRREIRDTPRVRGLYEIAWVILTEPCTLYTANFLLFIGTWWTGDNVSHILRPILAETQVRAFSRFHGASKSWNEVDYSW